MHLFCNMSGSNSEMEQSSSVLSTAFTGSDSTYHHISVFIVCIMFYVLKHQEPKSWGLAFIPLIFVELFSRKRLPSFGKGQQSRGDTAGFRFVFSNHFKQGEQVVVYTCGEESWNYLLSHRSWDASRAWLSSARLFRLLLHCRQACEA